MSSPSLQGQWGSSTTFLFYVQPFQHKQQQRQHWQHQHNRQHSSSNNTRSVHIDGDRQLARNSRGARFFFCRVLWKWQFQISRTFFCPSVLPSRSLSPVWLVWPVTNKSWKLGKYCIMSDLFQLIYDNLSGLVLQLCFGCKIANGWKVVCCYMGVW